MVSGGMQVTLVFKPKTREGKKSSWRIAQF